MPTLIRKFGGGPVQQDGARMYRHPIDGRLYPSVTEYLSVKDKPALITWAASQEKKGLLADMTAMLSKWGDEPFTPGQMLKIIKSHEEAPLRFRKVSKEARDIGSSVHAWIEWWTKGQLGDVIGPEPILLPGADVARDAFLKWVASVQFEPMAVEVTVFHPEHRYAGTYDLKARINGKVCIVDWKTSKGIYPEYRMQNLAYRAADALTANGNRSQGGYIVKIAKTIDDPVPIDPTFVPYDQSTLDAFLACGTLWRWQRTQDGKSIGGPWQ